MPEQPSPPDAFDPRPAAAPEAHPVPRLVDLPLFHQPAASPPPPSDQPAPIDLRSAQPGHPALSASGTGHGPGSGGYDSADPAAVQAAAEQAREAARDTAQACGLPVDRFLG